MALILASGSPRRRELMALITPDYTVITSDVDEGKIAADTPAHLAQSLASAKARAVAKLHPADTVLGFDTVVDCGGEVFGKPQDEADALRMLRALSGRTVWSVRDWIMSSGTWTFRSQRPLHRSSSHSSW